MSDPDDAPPPEAEPKIVTTTGTAVGTSTAEGVSTSRGYGQGAYGQGPYGGGTEQDLFAINEDGDHLLISADGDSLAIDSHWDRDGIQIEEQGEARDELDAGVTRPSGHVIGPAVSVVEVPEPPSVPPPRSAAIEPEWVEGRLRLRQGPALADLGTDQLSALLSVLRSDVQDFAEELSGANVDGRFVKYLRRVAGSIPDHLPGQIEVFQLGHATDLLAAYANGFADEATSAFQVEQYKSLVTRLQQTVAQFPSWRDFKRNTLAEELTSEQVEIAPTLARELAAAMETEDARTFIDPSLPQALEDLATTEDHPPSVANAGKDLRAADIVGSINNILGALAEVVTAIGKPVADAVGRGAVKGIEKSTENVVVFTANALALMTFARLFPQQFGWVAAFAVFAHAIGEALKKFGG